MVERGRALASGDGEVEDVGHGGGNQPEVDSLVCR